MGSNVRPHIYCVTVKFDCTNTEAGTGTTAVTLRLFTSQVGLFSKLKKNLDPILSCFPSFSLPDVLCDPTELIWRKGTPLKAMTGRRAPSSDHLLAEVF